MQQEGVRPDSVTFVGVLNAFVGTVAVAEGRCVHEEIFQSGYKSDACVGNSFVDIYGKCGSMEDAWKAFNKMPSQKLVTLTSIILANVKYGQGQ
jgi:pentatricopeptide repeat protein